MSETVMACPNRDAWEVNHRAGYPAMWCWQCNAVVGSVGSPCSWPESQTALASPHDSPPPNPDDAPKSLETR